MLVNQESPRVHAPGVSNYWLYWEAENDRDRDRAPCILKAESESQPDDYTWYVAKVRQKMPGWS